MYTPYFDKKLVAITLIAAMSLPACTSSVSIHPESEEQPNEVVERTQESQQSQEGQSTEDLEKAILERVAQLPEYKHAASMIDSITNHRHGISRMITAPEKGSSYYEVTVGYNAPKRFETYNIFYVDPNTLQVKVYDDMSGEIISIEDWRNRIGD